MFDVEAVRSELPSVLGNAYLNTGTFGPLPRAVVEAMQSHLGEAYTHGRVGERAYAQWGELTGAVRAAFARLTDAEPAQIALTHSTTDGIDLVVFGLEFEAGDEVVTTTHEHPGLVAPLEELARRRGVVVRTVDPSRAALRAALTPRTRLVAVSHVLWTTGDTLPLTLISTDAHEAGALVLVDGAQSGGSIPVAPAALGVDFYAFSGQKWLMGPSATGAVWIRPTRLDALATTWPSYMTKRRRPGEPVTDWPDARRLDAGTIDQASLAGIAAAIAWREQIGLADSITIAAARALELRELLDDLDRVEVVRVAEPSSIVSFRVSGADPDRVARDCEQAGVLVRSIPGFGLVRASVGFWNTTSDLERLVRCLSAG
jgi:L-cysteine/cystine lyase